MSDWGNVENSGDLYSETDRQFARSTHAKTPSAKRLRQEADAETHLDKRGMGETGVTHRVMTDAEKMTACMLLGKGLTHAEIAEKLKRSPQVISNMFRNIEKMARAQGLNYDWREDLKQKSIAAIRAGLVHDKDPYKQAAVGVQTMKGIGEFEKDGGDTNVVSFINGIPEHMRERYLSNDPAPVNLISSESETVPATP